MNVSSYTISNGEWSESITIHPTTIQYCMVIEDEKTKTKSQMTHQVDLTKDANRVIDEKGNTWLHEAASKGCEAMVRGFINQGESNKIDWDITNAAGHTPLMVASRSTSGSLVGRLTVIELLIGAGADINVRSFPAGWTALHHAAFAGNTQIVKFLLQNGAQITECVLYTGGISKTGSSGLKGCTSIFLALMYGDEQMVEALIEAGDSNLNHVFSDGTNAYHYLAARDKDKDIPDALIQILKKYQVNPKQEADNGEPPLLHCKPRHQNLMAAIIGEYSQEEINMKSPVTGHTVLYHVNGYGSHPLTRFETILLDNGADPNCPHAAEEGNEDHSPFCHYARKLSDAEFDNRNPTYELPRLRLYLSKGAKIDPIIKKYFSVYLNKYQLSRLRNHWNYLKEMQARNEMQKLINDNSDSSCLIS